MGQVYQVEYLLGWGFMKYWTYGDGDISLGLALEKKTVFNRLLLRIHPWDSAKKLFTRKGVMELGKIVGARRSLANSQIYF